MQFDEFLGRFEGVKKSGNRYMARCPAHDDKKPSLSINAGSDGTILLKCFAGCETETIVSAIGLEMRDLFSENTSRPADSRQSYALPKGKFERLGEPQHDDPFHSYTLQKGEIETVYAYRDETGKVLYENVRYAPKSFRQRRLDENGEYVFSLDGIERVPYHLPDIVASKERDFVEVWFTEGEKDANNLNSLGFTASSFKNWTDGLNRHIKDVHVVLFRDHDTSGVTQSEKAAGMMSKVASSVKIVNLFDSEPIPDKHGKDVSDWIKAKRDEGLAGLEIAEQLSIQVNGAKEYEALPERPDANTGFRFSFSSLDEMYDEPDEETAYVWDKTLPVSGFSIISAKPKVGKSTILRNLAVAISRGEPFLGRETTQGKVLYLCLEEKRNEVRRQFQHMGAKGNAILVHSDSRPKTTIDAINGLRAAIADHKPSIVFIDLLSRVIRSADFNDYAITYSLEPFIDLARDTGVHISALHHDGKGDREGGDAILGSTALYGAVDCHLSVKKRQGIRVLASTQRYGEDLPETVIELNKETGIIIDKGELQTAILAEVMTEVLIALGSESLDQTDIKERLQNRTSGGLVSKAIKALHDEGRISRTGSGKKGDPFIYGVTAWESQCAGNG